MYVSMLFSLQIFGKDEKEREEAADMAQLMTPIIKAFFTAFMLSITPFAFNHIVTANFAEVFARPERIALTIIEAMFMIDVMIGTVGYIVTMRPLDAHGKSEHMAEFQTFMAANPPKARELRVYETDEGQPLG